MASAWDRPRTECNLGDPLTAADINAMVAQIKARLVTPTLLTGQYVLFDGTAFTGGTPAGSGGESCFIRDANGDLMPSPTATSDDYWERDTNGDLMLKGA